MESDAACMARAIQLAKRGAFSTHPNPSVGCVIVKEGRLVGEGHHVKAGGHHAEVHALDAAAGSARGATAYVTLEPCSFKGRTPACTDRLIEDGVKEVFVAMQDPDPRNAGKGIRALEAAGISVQTGLLATAAARLNPGHIKRHCEGLPYTRLKLAMTMDGRTALANGESRWITSDASRRDVQRLRARSSAIVTGVQTVIDDKPSLRVRPAGLELPHPEAALSLVRPIYILDSSGRLPLDAGILRQKEVVLVTGVGLPLPLSVTRLEVATKDGRIDLRGFLTLLAEAEHSEVLFECGATLGGSLLSEGLVDELVLYVAPAFMGAGARPLLNLPEIDRMSDLVRLDTVDIRRLGTDVRITLRPFRQQDKGDDKDD